MAKKILMLCGDYGEDYETVVPFQTLLAAVPGIIKGKRISAYPVCRAKIVLVL